MLLTILYIYKKITKTAIKLKKPILSKQTKLQYLLSTIHKEKNLLKDYYFLNYVNG